MRTIVERFSVRAGVNKRIALVSDLHGRVNADALKILKKEQPEIICAAGDMFEAFERTTRRHDYASEPIFMRLFHMLIWRTDTILRFIWGKPEETSFENALDFLSECAKIAPTYYAAGNHDPTLTYAQRKQLRAASVNIIFGIPQKCGDITICGIPPYASLARARAMAREKGIKIAVAHHPTDFEDFLRFMDYSLVLSGHAHGGQWRLFGRGLFAPTEGLFPKYTRGLYHKRLVVSAGLANTSVIPRIFNPAEVVIIEMKQ